MPFASEFLNGFMSKGKKYLFQNLKHYIRYILCMDITKL